MELSLTLEMKDDMQKCNRASKALAEIECSDAFFNFIKERKKQWVWYLQKKHLLSLSLQQLFFMFLSI